MADSPPRRKFISPVKDAADNGGFWPISSNLARTHIVYLVVNSDID
jgi:hypothetical protein